MTGSIHFRNRPESTRFSQPACLPDVQAYIQQPSPSIIITIAASMNQPQHHNDQQRPHQPDISSTIAIDGSIQHQHRSIRQVITSNIYHQTRRSRRCRTSDSRPTGLACQQAAPGTTSTARPPGCLRLIDQFVAFVRDQLASPSAGVRPIRSPFIAMLMDLEKMIDYEKIIDFRSPTGRSLFDRDI